MHRRTWIGLLAAAVLAPWRIWADERNPTFGEMLEKGLRCRRPEEFTFVRDISQRVEQGQLSRELVLSTYRWAIEQRADIPFYYFQYAIRLRAKKAGVVL